MSKTDLTLWKTSSGHNPAMVRPIHFMFSFMVGFSILAHQTVYFLVGPNPRWLLAAILKVLSVPIFAVDHVGKDKK